MNTKQWGGHSQTCKQFITLTGQVRKVKVNPEKISMYFRLAEEEVEEHKDHPRTIVYIEGVPNPQAFHESEEQIEKMLQNLKNGV